MLNTVSTPSTLPASAAYPTRLIDIYERTEANEQQMHPNAAPIAHEVSIDWTLP